MIKWRLPQRDRHFFNLDDTDANKIEAFSSRKDIFKSIKQKLDDCGYTSLSGLSGSGKTALAVEHAHRHLSLYEEIYFIQGNDLYAQLSDIVLELHQINPDNLSFADLCKIIFQSKREKKRCLFILDNTNISEQVKLFLDHALEHNNSEVLLTSNSQHWQSIVNIFSLTKLESECFIRKHLLTESRASITALSHLLGGLPLAIVQAVSYIKTTAISIKDYLLLFNQHPDQILKTNKTYLWQNNFPYSVYKTLSLNLENLKKESREAFELLEFFRCFNYENIPREIITLLVESDFLLNDHVATLLNHSLLVISNDKKFFNIHCLIHKILETSISKYKQKKLLKKILAVLHKHYFYSRNKPELFQTFLKHAAHFKKMIAHGENFLGENIDFNRYYCLLVASLGLYETFERHNIERSKEYLLKTIELIKNYEIKLDVNTIGMIYNGIGHSFLLCGKNEAAKSELYFSKAINLRYKKENETKAYALSGFGFCCFLQKKYNEAISCGTDALKRAIKLFGDNHIDIPHFRYRLALCYNAIGELQKARKLCIDSIEMGKNISIDGS